tara:strand:+ start:393 stop:572 length:180 start_codon:yes stop_codon:yes gene_type:complete
MNELERKKRVGLWAEVRERLFELHLICGGTKEDFPRVWGEMLVCFVDGSLGLRKEEVET